MNIENEQEPLLSSIEKVSNISDTTQQTEQKRVEKSSRKQLFPKKYIKRQKTLNNGGDDDDFPINPISDIFLKIVYPLTSFIDKSIVIGIFKSLDFAPGILLLHNSKYVLFSENSWNSFTKNMNLVDCYLINKVYGKKTSVRLSDSDIEIDNVKLRFAQGVRFRDLTRYESKVILKDQEFAVMMAVTPAINRYLEQLSFCGPVIKDYLIDAICKQPTMHLIYGPIDTSIYNRLPQEVDLFRSMMNTKLTIENENEKEENGEVNEEEGEDVESATSNSDA